MAMWREKVHCLTIRQHVYGSSVQAGGAGTNRQDSEQDRHNRSRAGPVPIVCSRQKIRADHLQIVAA